MLNELKYNICALLEFTGIVESTCEAVDLPEKFASAKQRNTDQIGDIIKFNNKYDAVNILRVRIILNICCLAFQDFLVRFCLPIP